MLSSSPATSINCQQNNNMTLNQAALDSFRRNDLHSWTTWTTIRCSSTTLVQMHQRVAPKGSNMTYRRRSIEDVLDEALRISAKAM